MQIQKEGRAYILLLPFNCYVDELKQVLQEFADNAQKEQKQRDEMAEKAKLEAEMHNQKAEAGA